ncbi:glyoxalase superfamily protein [Brevibacterium sediminis]
MTSIDDAKSMARRLRDELREQEGIPSHSRALELVAKSFGYRDWNTFVASEDVSPAVVPILLTFPGGAPIFIHRPRMGS